MHPTPAPTGGSQPDAIALDNTNGDHNNSDNNNNNAVPSSRRDSMSQKSEGSQTAADFIRDQMQLEADAREALPYSFRDCTRPLGSLRQNVYACLTCNPPPANPDDPYTAAGVCYSCSVQCHGEHELVELFKKRNFVCDCGTTRFSPDQPCRIRINPETNTRGNVHSEQPDPNNKYNQNFRNRFCSCSIDYRPHEQTGTMFQCLGLGTHETGGCGEEWYHPGCLVGQGPKWYEGLSKATSNGALAPIAEDPSHETNDGQQANGVNIADGDDQDEDVPLPDGFPNEDEFELLFCYKCVEAYPWIKRYVGTPGFLPPVFLQRPDEVVEEVPTAKKRKLGDDGTRKEEEAPNKRIKSDPNAENEDNLLGSAASDDTSTEVKGEDTKDTITPKAPECKLTSLPPAPNGVFSIFVKADFRDHFCRCPSCFPYLKPHPQLLEQEEDYDPPLSDGSENESTHGSGSLYERGESALKNVDRVRAIEGVMAYNNLKEKLKPFFQQFAESGKAIGAEDIKEYFAKLRGDDQAIKEASESAKEDHRREQSGY
ncbi:putative metaphase-anaphase transition protein [Rosellinia necatrix]|uniref:Putative metaphase-anaphase transition protein n=1 Tax=Rosellinia necatrix TaxID=77044 RepID=A0A1S7UJ27_ROSNE|nr:putative metaphase-anaphase transition protein [Rosellinia necatrix]